jgi:hypothetical protein
MEITVTEMLLFAWAVGATMMWQQSREELKHFRFMTVMTLRKLHKGEIKIVDHGDSFELRDVK